MGGGEGKDRSYPLITRGSRENLVADVTARVSDLTVCQNDSRAGARVMHEKSRRMETEAQGKMSNGILLNVRDLLCSLRMSYAE